MRASLLALAATALPRPRSSALLPPLRAGSAFARRAVHARSCAAAANGAFGRAQENKIATLTLTLGDPSATGSLGAILASLAVPGDAIMLHGDYGAGKTCLARGFLRRWYSNPAKLVSPPLTRIGNAPQPQP